jgi:hypothetical protein
MISKEKNMSKSTKKVVFALLIALVLIVGIYTTVLGAFASAGSQGGQVHVDASLKPDLAHVRSSPVQALQSSMPQGEMKSGHDCHSESYTDPSD